MKILILLSCLRVLVVSARESISCDIPAVEPLAATSLTCTFPEDLSMARKDFSVRYSKSIGKPVLDCLWVQGKLECFEAPGFLFNRTVSSQLTILIPRAFPNMTGEYYCKVSDSTGLEIKHCPLVLIQDFYINTNKTTDTNNEKNTPLVIGLISAFVIVAVIVVVIVLFFRKRLPFTRKREQGRHEEEHPMMSSIFYDNNAEAEIQISEKQKQITKDFQRYLEESVNKMYPNISHGCYFMPPIYFNKTGYTRQSFHDQGVYVPEPSEPSEVKHDRAMQHIMHCLHHFAQHGEEQMFVLTQFQYEDYLNSPDDNFARHKLPVPAGLPVPSDNEEKVYNTACFDFLIVHRLHGVLVGVVKAVGAEDEKSRHDQKTEDERVVDDVKEAVEQLNKADRMFRHLMSDQQSCPKVQKTLILPNLTQASLQRTLKHRTHKDVVDMLRQHWDVDTLEDPTNHILCSEHLSKHNEPWNVSKQVIKNMQHFWMWTTSNNESDVTDDVYLSIIARFFGPATQSTLQVPGNCERFRLPKTLSETVSLTGDLFGRSVLHQDIIKRLNEESKGFLVGPPNTGKTRMLTIVGGKCLSNGQNVFVVKDKSSPNDSFLSQHLIKLKQKQNSQPTSDRIYGSIYEETCNLNENESVEELIQKVVDQKGDCVLLDIGHLKGKHANTFCKAILKRCPDLQLWVSCTGDSSPAILPYSKHCTEILNCPPAVLREVATTKGNTNKGEDTKNKNLTLPPTDGPPVKIIHYQLSIRCQPHDSLKCGQDVGSFLTNELLLTGTGTDESASQSVRRAHLQCKDVLILFEKDFAIAEESNFLKGLRQSGIIVHAAERNENNVVVDGDVDSAWAMSVHCMDTYRVKRKVVVYVEYYTVFATDQENKKRALTSCTSQLILVKPLLTVSSLLATETST